MQTYPYHAINNMEMAHKEKDRAGNTVEVRDESFLVLVPQGQNKAQAPMAVNAQPAKESPDRQADPSPQSSETPAVTAPQPVKPRGGKLRSIGD